MLDIRSLKGKIIIINIGLFILGIATFYFIGIPQIIQKSFDYEIDNIQQEGELLKGLVTKERERSASDVLALALTPPVKGIIRAENNNGYDTLDNSSRDQWVARLQHIFKTAMEANPSFFFQLRYIDEDGYEIVRVDQTQDGQTYVVPENEFQYKGNRVYFQEAMQRESGELYISKIELNREGNPPVVSKPHELVIRLAYPIFGYEGERRGIIIANIRAQRYFNEIYDNTEEGFFLTDSQGYYLASQFQEKLYGSPGDLDTGESISRDFPGYAEEIISNKKGFIHRDGQIFWFEKITVDPNDPYKDLLLIRYIANDKTIGPHDTIQRLSMITFGSILIVYTAITIYLLYIWVVKPIGALKTSVTQIGKGDFSKDIIIGSKDEIGQLANEFNIMKSNLSGLYERMDETVEAKTQELEQNVEKLTETNESLEKTKTAMLNIAEDLEKDKRLVLEEKLRDEAMLASIGDGIIVVDTQEKTVRMNPVAEQLLGYTEKDLIGKNYLDTVKAETKEGEPILKAERAMLRAIDRRTKITESFVYIRKDGTKFVADVTNAPIFLENELIGDIIVIRDVTKQEEINKAKTEFISLASHQLRTPLSAIRWYIELLMDEENGKLTKEQKEHLEEICMGNKRMVALVNALLNTSRIETGTFMIDPQPTDIVKIAKEALAESELKIKEKNLDIQLKTTRLPKINVDPNLTNIILQNLITNAVKYTPSKGKIIIEIGKEKDKEAIRICVKDNGYGIPKAEQEHIFEKLYRATNIKERETDGTGLGLYMVKQILERAGGKISFKSTEGKGTTFCVDLPISGMKKKEGTRKLGS